MNPDPFLVKLRLIFRPFLLINVCLTVIYTMLHWLLVIRLQWFEPREENIRIWWIILLNFLVSHALLLPRIRLLRLPGNFLLSFSLLYLVLSVGATSIPAIFYQSRLILRTIEVGFITDISQVKRQDKERYCDLGDGFVHSSHTSTLDTNFTGTVLMPAKFQHFDVVPIYKHLSDTLHGIPAAWSGYIAEEEPDPSLSPQEKERAYQQFVEKNNRRSKKRSSVTYIGYLSQRQVEAERVPESHRKDCFKIAIERSGKSAKPSPVVFVSSPHNQAFSFRWYEESDIIYLIPWLVGIGGWFLLILIPPLDQAAVAEFQNRDTGIRQMVNDFLALFIPRKGYFITPLLIDLNIALLLLMLLTDPGGLVLRTETLTMWGANFKTATFNDGWWRLLTGIFTHINTIQLLINLYFLLYISSFLETALGWAKLAGAFLLTGFVAGLLSLFVHAYDLMPYCGTNGAIVGLYGLLTGLLCTPTFDRALRKKLVAAIVLPLIYGFATFFITPLDQSMPELAALLTGFVRGIAMYFVEFRKHAYKTVAGSA